MASAQTKTATKHVITHCLQCFLYMGIPKFIKMDNGFGYTTKHFSSFVPNAISNIKQAVLIILKDKESWSVPMAP